MQSDNSTEPDVNQLEGPVGEPVPPHHLALPRRPHVLPLPVGAAAHLGFGRIVASKLVLKRPNLFVNLVESERTVVQSD